MDRNPEQKSPDTHAKTKTNTMSINPMNKFQEDQDQPTKEVSDDRRQDEVFEANV
jgi:hypothetical protein